MEESEKEVKETVKVEIVDMDGPHPTFKGKIKKGYTNNKIVFWLTQCSFSIALILFITLSLTVKGPFGPYNLNGWGLWWIFFLITPTLPLVYKGITTFKLNLIPIDALVIIAFLLVGLLTGKWHPYWALLFISPAYHIIVSSIKK